MLHNALYHHDTGRDGAFTSCNIMYVLCEELEQTFEMKQSETNFRTRCFPTVIFILGMETTNTGCQATIDELQTTWRQKIKRADSNNRAPLLNWEIQIDSNIKLSILFLLVYNYIGMNL